MSKKTTLAVAIGTVVGVMSAPLVCAKDNPFRMKDLPNGYNIQATDEKTSEGKCGSSKKGTEGKCGSQKGTEGKCGSSQKGSEGKCGSKTDEKSDKK